MAMRAPTIMPAPKVEVDRLMAPTANVLEIRGLVKDFPSVRAVNEVSFDVKRNTVHSLIGSAPNPPYTLRWRDVPAGTYQLIAVATNGLGIQTISRAVTVTVK